MKWQVVGDGSYYLAVLFLYGNAVDEIEQDLFDLVGGSKGEDLLNILCNLDQVHI